MLLIVWPLAFALVGALIYALAANGKVSTLGLYAYICGLFWVVALLAHDVVRLR